MCCVDLDHLLGRQRMLACEVVVQVVANPFGLPGLVAYRLQELTGRVEQGQLDAIAPKGLSGQRHKFCQRVQILGVDEPSQQVLEIARRGCRATAPAE